MSKLVFLLLLSTVSAFANPRAKLCRGSTVMTADYQEFLAIASGAEKIVCFHLGRITGGVEENMTFKPEARKNLTPELLAMADEMVDRAKSLRGFCDGQPVSGHFEKGVREGDRSELHAEMDRMFGPEQLNWRILHATCDAE